MIFMAHACPAVHYLKPCEWASGSVLRGSLPGPGYCEMTRRLGSIGSGVLHWGYAILSTYSCTMCKSTAYVLKCHGMESALVCSCLQVGLCFARVAMLKCED
jgi:hypothetical protein